jgi:hypothetical protein
MVKDMTSQKHLGATPHGGDSAVSYFLGDDGAPVSKDEATNVEIVEYKDGEQIARTYGTFSRSAMDV